MTAELAPHPVMVASTERGGTQLHTLRPTHFVDPGEQNLFQFLVWQMVSRNREERRCGKNSLVHFCPKFVTR